MSEECLFCRIIKGDVPSTKVYEDDLVYAFKDINPQAPVHVLIIPKKHISGVPDIMDDDKELIGHIYRVASRIAKEKACLQCGFRIVVNSGPDAGQTVFHLHFHLLGGRTLRWPPG